MKKQLQKSILICLLILPSLTPILKAQIDLTIGLNYGYNPPKNCDNKITSLEFDVCNNGSDPASAFEVGVYLYDPSSSSKWIIASTTLNSLSGNACKTISNWDIDMNNFCCLPTPGTAYRIGVWADTANAITETTKNNNATLLSGNIQVCAKTATGIKVLATSLSSFELYPNPSANKIELALNLTREEKISVTLLDIHGKEVSKIMEDKLQVGEQKIEVNHGLQSGIYFVNVNVAGTIFAKKLIVEN